MSKSITKEIKTEVLEKVAVFNKEHKTTFQMSFRGKFAYLSKTEKYKELMSDEYIKLLYKSKFFIKKRIKSMHKYRLIRKLGEGTFSEVLKA